MTAQEILDNFIADVATTDVDFEQLRSDLDQAFSEARALFHQYVDFCEEMTRESDYSVLTQKAYSGRGSLILANNQIDRIYSVVHQIASGEGYE